MRWWVVLCVALLWDTASLQPTNTDNDRECCPCPKDSDVASSNTLNAVNPFTAASGTARAAGGCPCPLRSADSDGAPSTFLPAAVRAIRPFVSLDDSKEDPKPLLHPEVDLASSVLDTLREATNEEYEEALARDAARAAQESDGVAAETAPMVTIVVSPEDADASYTDDVMGEASHVHEARCTNPLGRSSVNIRGSTYDTPDILSVLRLPKRKSQAFRTRNLFDMDSGVGASNNNEQVVEPTDKESAVETPKTANSPTLQVPSLFKNSKGGENYGGSILNKLRESKGGLPKHKTSKLFPKLDTTNLFRKSGDADPNLTTNMIDKENCDSPSAFKLKIPHISTLARNIDTSKHVKENKQDTLSTINDNHGENSSPSMKLYIPNISQIIPKIGSSNVQDKETSNSRRSENHVIPKLPNLKQTVRNNLVTSDDVIDSDSMDSASTIKDRYSSFAKVDDTDRSKYSESSTVESCNDLKTPAVKSINLNNIDSNIQDDTPTLNSNELTVKVPDLKLLPSKSRDATTDLVNNILRGIRVPSLSNLISNNIFNLKKNDQATKTTEEIANILPNNTFSTEILDTVPSASEPQTDHVNFIEREQGDDLSKIDKKIQEEIENMPIKTEILENIPKSSQINDSETTEDSAVNETESDDDNDDLIHSASEQSQKSLGNDDEEVTELVNEMEEMNDDSIDDMIDNTNDGIMDRENNNVNIEGEFDSSRDSSGEAGKDDFVFENKIDGLAINSDIQSLNEKSVPEVSTVNKKVPLRERLRQKIETLKSAPKINIDFTKVKGITKLQQDKVVADIQNKDAMTTEQDMDSENACESVDKVDINDLQQMSDSLLNQEQQQKEAPARNATLANNNEQSNLSKDVEIPDGNILESNNINSIKKVENECIVNATPNENTETDITNESKNNEMAVGASERVASIAGPDFNLASPLRQSKVLEPLSFGSDSNIFNGPSLDLSNLLNNPLPKFTIPNLLNPGADNYINIFSTNDETDTDSSAEELQPSLSAQPSTSYFRLRLPPLQPLEDINLDILQLKPLSTDMPTLPRLNLNSFKTRLAIPKSLDLKPVLLESSIGNKKGVIGATLTLGSDKKLDPSNLLEQASSKSANILRQSLGSLPSLDDFHENFWEKTQNLLSTPLELTGRNAVEDTLRSSQVLTENLRVHAENAMKDMHQNLASSLRGVGLHNQGSFGSLRSSSSLLEEVSRRHEDVNDKLKGISVDLSDRLESLRDNILEQHRSPLGSSILGQSILPSLSFAKPKHSNTFRTSTKPQNSLKLSSKGKFVTPASKRKSIGRTSSSKSKLKTASSMVAPKTIETPKFKTASTESSVLKALRNEPSLKKPHFLSRPALGLIKQEKNLIDFNKHLIKKPRLGQSKIKISFSTTPLPPVLKSKPSFRSDSTLREKPFLKDTVPKQPKSVFKDRSASKFGSFKDSSAFGSETIPSRVEAPLRIPESFKTATGDLDTRTIPTTVRPALKLSLTKPKSSIGDIMKSAPSIPDDITSPAHNVLRHDISKMPSLSWPKKIDDEFLTKVREALRARLAEIGRKTVKPAKPKSGKLELSPDAINDMARSASNNNEVIDSKIMTENTSYTCKMMCTKNT